MHDGGPAALMWPLPAWLRDVVAAQPVLLDLDDRMRFVIGLASTNVARQTGGPYAAGVFDSASGSLIAAGVDLVATIRCSSAHAEVVALSYAQSAVGSHELGARMALELVASAEPCVMCLGATLWSGVRSLVCGTREEDWRRFGFDDLAKPADWVGELSARGVATTRDVLRDEALAPLEAYAQRACLVHH